MGFFFLFLFFLFFHSLTLGCAQYCARTVQVRIIGMIGGKGGAPINRPAGGITLFCPRCPTGTISIGHLVYRIVPCNPGTVPVGVS